MHGFDQEITIVTRIIARTAEIWLEQLTTDRDPDGKEAG
jgi:hypothetical protein